MIQPFVLPPEVTGRVPLPEKGLPGVGVEDGSVPVDVDGGVPVLGRYLIPLAGQLDLDPSESNQSREDC